MELDTRDFFFISKFLEGFLFGLYAGVFTLYLHYSAKKGSINTILSYALCVLYILTAVIMTLDTMDYVLGSNPNISFQLLLRLEALQPTVFGCCDFIAQSILIYRCWIMWRLNIRVVIIPIIMALAFLALWMAGIGGNSIGPDGFESTAWSTDVTITSLVMSTTLNALVTGFIVFRIFKVFREVKATTTLDEKTLGVAGGRKLSYIMFVIIESGMALFSIQLARVVSTALSTSNTENDENAFNLIVSIHEMLNGITPTIILVRVSMGLSFHDETSMVDAVGSLRFAANDPFPIPEMRGIKESDIICENDDIQMLERS